MSAAPDDLGDNSDGDGFTYDDSAVATPFRCDFCKAGFPSTTEMKHNHRSIHLRPHKCFIEGCHQSFKQQQALDRHHQALHRSSAIPSKYFHCVAQGCKYSRSSSRDKFFTREDHVKAHIKDMGHYGPHSPVDRKKRPRGNQGIMFNQAIILAVYEEWNVSESTQPQWNVKFCRFNSLKTNLWHEDITSDLYARGGSLIATAFHCEEAGCYFNMCSVLPEILTPTAFKTAEGLREHYRRAHELSKQTFASSYLSLSERQLSTSSLDHMESPNLPLLGPLSQITTLPFDQLYGTDFLTPSNEPWNPQRLLHPPPETHEQSYKQTSRDSFVDFLGAEGNSFLLDSAGEKVVYKAEQETLPDETDSIQPVASMTPYTPDYLSRSVTQRSYSESDGFSVYSGGVTSPPESVASTMSIRNRNVGSNSANSARIPIHCTFPGCVKKISRKADIERHMRSVHSVSRPFQCKICSRSFSRKDKLKEHVLKHHGQTLEANSMKLVLTETSIDSRESDFDEQMETMSRGSLAAMR